MRDMTRREEADHADIKALRGQVADLRRQLRAVTRFVDAAKAAPQHPIDRWWIGELDRILGRGRATS